MSQHPVTRSRRRFLRLVGAGAAAAGLSTAAGAQEADGQFVLEQGDRCAPVEPFSGDEPVEDVYDYRYPVDRFEGPPGTEGSTYSSHGTTDLQRDDTSVVFLYDGPEGVSLVLVHGRLDGDGAGGTIRFTFEGLPDGGEWVVRDDYYLRNGEQPASNLDRWDVDGDAHTADWAYRGGRTDGGVFRGLEDAAAVRIDPAFGDEAPLSSDRDFGPVESWELLSGDMDAPDRLSLRLDEPVTIRRGECPDDADGFGRGVDVRITRASVADGVYATGEDVPADVAVENTGSRARTVYLGYSVFGPDGEGRHNDGTTDERITVPAGETATTTLTWTVEGDAPSGNYDAVVALWRDREGNDLQGRLDDRRVAAAFQVVGG